MHKHNKLTSYYFYIVNPSLYMLFLLYFLGSFMLILSVIVPISLCITTANIDAPAITTTTVAIYCSQPSPKIRLSPNFSTIRKTIICAKYISMLMELKNFMALFPVPPPIGNGIYQQSAGYQQAHNCISANNVIKNNSTSGNPKGNPLIQPGKFILI